MFSFSFLLHLGPPCSQPMTSVCCILKIKPCKCINSFETIRAWVGQIYPHSDLVSSSDYNSYVNNPRFMQENHSFTLTPLYNDIKLGRTPEETLMIPFT